MSLWKYRSATQPAQEFEMPGPNLLPLLQQRVLGPGHQFLPPGGSAWISAPEALYLLMVPGAAAAPSPPVAPPRATPPPPPRSPTAAPRWSEPPPSAARREQPDDEDEDIPVGRPVPGGPTPSPPPIPRQPPASLRPASVSPPPVVPPPPARPTPAPPIATPPPPRPVAPPRVASPPPTPAAVSREAALAKIAADENERPRLTPPRADDEDELEMTPMIDVTFLLLIFFMVSSTVSQFASLQLPEANTGDAENPETRVVLVLDFPDGGNDASAEKFQGGQPILLADARLRLSNSQELLDAATLEERLRTSFQEQGKTQLILQAHRKMPASVVREVLNIGRRAGAVKTLVGVSVAK